MAQDQDPVVIVAAARMPMGGFQGELAGVSATELGGIAIAGGMESMTNAPCLLPKARSGLRLGHGQMPDHMFYDGLEGHYFDKGRPMGSFAEDCASSYHYTREQQDAFKKDGAESPRRA